MDSDETSSGSAQFRETLVHLLGHDLRNPLSAILMNVRLLLKSDALAAAPQRHATRIAASAERLDRMLRDVVDLTRAHLGGNLPLATRACGLADICRGVIDQLSAGEPNDRTRVTLDGDGHGQWDADRLAHVVRTLLTAALARSPTDASVRISLRDVGAEVALEVHDRGEPLTAHERSEFFDTFGGPTDDGTAWAATRTASYVSARIVKAHGGTLRLSSTPGDGTTFTVVLPK